MSSEEGQALPGARILSAAFTAAVERHPGASAMLGLLGVERVASRRFLREQLVPALCDPEQSPSSGALRLLFAALCLCRLSDVTAAQFVAWTEEHGGCILFDTLGTPVNVALTEKPFVLSHSFAKLAALEDVDELEVWPHGADPPQRHHLLSSDYAKALAAHASHRNTLRAGYDVLTALGVRRLFACEKNSGDEALPSTLEAPVLCDLLTVVQAAPAVALDANHLWFGLARHAHIVMNSGKTAAFARTRALLASTAWVRAEGGRYICPADGNMQGDASQRLGSLLILVNVPLAAVPVAEALGLLRTPNAAKVAERWKARCLASKQEDGAMADVLVSLRQSLAVLECIVSAPGLLSGLEDVPFLFVPHHEKALDKAKWQAHVQSRVEIPLDPNQPLAGRFYLPSACAVHDASNVFDSAAHSMDKESIALAQQLGIVRVLDRHVRVGEGGEEGLCRLFFFEAEGESVAPLSSFF